MLRRLPVLPLFYADRRLQTIWIDDVCQGLVRTVERSLGGTVLLAHPESTPMREFYRGIAAVDGIRLKVCPFPGDLALFGIRLLEQIGLKPPITTDNLVAHQSHLRRLVLLTIWHARSEALKPGIAFTAAAKIALN